MNAFDAEHAIDVAGRVYGKDAKLVALLHDAVEDGVCELQALREAGFPADVVEAVDTLTRRFSETYEDYIARVAGGSELARAVKLADLEANVARMDDAHRRHLPRYERAIELLKGAA